MPAVQATVDRVKAIDVSEYKYGFFSDIESDKAPKGLNEDIVRFISAKKDEPAWLTEWRLGAYRRWLTMQEPRWARVDFPKIDYQDLYYYSAPKTAAGPKSLDEVDPELLKVYAKLGIPLREQEALAGMGPDRRIAVDAVFELYLGRHHLQGGTGQGRGDFLSDLGSRAYKSRPRPEISWIGGAHDGQFLRDAE